MFTKLSDQIDQLNLEARQKQNRLYRPAKLGDGKGRWQSNPYVPGYVLIREQASDGRLSTPRNVLLPSDVNILLRDGANVRLGKNEQFQDIILGGDLNGNLSSGQDTNALAVRAQSVSTPQGFIETLRLMVKTGLTFSLKGWNVYISGVYHEFVFPDIGPVTVPSAGNMYYAVMAVLADLSGVEVKYSTQRPVTDLPLGEADVNEASALFVVSSTPVWALTLIGGQTTYAQSNIDNLIGVKDLRQLVNAVPGVGAGNVSGPGTSTDRAIATWNGTGGVLLRNNPLANVDVNGLLKATAYKLPAAIELTEISDAITITQGFHTVAAETGTSDNLSTINGGVSTQFVTLQAKATHTITIKNGIGNILLNNSADFVMSADKTVSLFYDGTNWADIGIGGSSTGEVSVLKPAAVATNGSNITISNPGTSTFDGVGLVAGDLLFLWNQSSGAENGLWTFNGSASALTRPTYYSAGSTSQAFAGIIVPVENGTLYGGTMWRLTTTGTVTINSTVTAWQRVQYNLNDAYLKLLVANGGTFQSSLTAHAALIGNGTGAVLTLAPGTARNVAISDGTDWTSRALVPDDLPYQPIKVKNVSGSTTNANEVGLLDYDVTNGYSYNTTTTANKDGTWCVVIIGGANNADIWVARRGRVTIKLNANCSIGNFLTTSTTAGQAAVNTLMRPEVFAVAVTANSGGAGGTCEAMLLTGSRYVPATSTSDIYTVVSSSSQNFVSTINGAPTATSVVYGAVSAGAANSIVPSGTPLFKARLYNTTRGNYRLITAVNTGTSTITTVSSTDNWASGDTINIESTTCISGLSYKFAELDLTQQTSIPKLARTVRMFCYVYDTGAAGTAGLVAQLLAAASSAVQQSQYNQAANTYCSTIMEHKIISNVICTTLFASGTATAQQIFRLMGYEEAVA